MKLPLKRGPRALPTQAELDARNPRRAALIIALTGILLMIGSVAWWAKNGAAFLHELAFRIETIHLYWTLVASPLDRKVWTGIIIALMLLLILVVKLAHRFVWRAIFPDFARLHPREHKGGMPERLGRLYRVRAYRDTDERVRYRHYYKHGDRWFPLFRFDHVDLDQPANPYLFGVSVARCGRLERDPAGSRFRRIAVDSAFPSHALEDEFHREEVEADQLRKTNIVAQGPSMNPEVMRRKATSQPSMDSFMEERSRALGLVPTAPRPEEDA